MLRGVFITGTDTGIGKTVAAAALMHRYRSNAPLRYWKPIQTGIEQDDDTATVRQLGECSAGEILVQGVRLRGPFSPHLSARLSGRTLAVNDIVRMADNFRDDVPTLVEGAGGVLVPLNAEELMIDLIAALQMPAVVVARTTLGTINHSLLTLEALHARAIAVLGVILVGPADEENLAAIETYGCVPVLGHLPMLAPLTSASLQAAAIAIDPGGRLGEHLR